MQYLFTGWTFNYDDIDSSQSVLVRFAEVSVAFRRIYVIVYNACFPSNNYQEGISDLAIRPLVFQFMPPGHRYL